MCLLLRIEAKLTFGPGLKVESTFLGVGTKEDFMMSSREIEGSSLCSPRGAKKFPCLVTCVGVGEKTEDKLFPNGVKSGVFLETQDTSRVGRTCLCEQVV